MGIVIINPPKKINTRSLKEFFKEAFRKSRLPSYKVLEIVFVSSKIIKRINFQYRKKNKPTTVLSFREEDSSFHLDPHYKGTILLCFSQIQKEAHIFDIALEQYFKKILIHGFLNFFPISKKKQLIKKLEKIPLCPFFDSQN